MNDFSTLSHEYASNALFANEINTLILKLKKFVFKTRGKKNLSKKEIKNAREKLVEYLEGILSELNRESLEPGNGKEKTALIPIDVIERIRDQYGNTMDDFIGDVNDLLDRLKSNGQIDSGDFQLLDTMCDTASSITSVSFRKLWSRH